ncbi:MAG: Na+/H+ antiporter NhaA [Actinomycetota bacterium]
MTRPRIAQSLRTFLETEAAGGVVLLAAAIAAILWANLSEASYSDVWAAELRLGAGSLTKTLDLRHWVNDGLMTIFFLVVGMEIKRELVVGELRDRRTSFVPVVAAAGGMIGPALVYLALNPQGPSSRGWGIPMATDIAFAVGVLAVAGRRAPPGARIFLLTLAIVDDIGAIAVVAIAYTEELSLDGIAIALAALGALAVLRRVGVRKVWVYLLPGAAVWWGVSASGIHPTIAGAMLGLMTPARPVRGRPVLDELQARLHPLSSFAIVPLFALANAGIAVDLRSLEAAVRSPIFGGVAAGLAIGKVFGIALPTVAVVRLTRARLPSGMGLRDVAGVGILGGIGFTVAIFIAELALGEPADVDAAKIGVVLASVACALSGAAVISFGRKRRAQSGSKSTRG